MAQTTTDPIAEEAKLVEKTMLKTMPLVQYIENTLPQILPQNYQYQPTGKWDANTREAFIDAIRHAEKTHLGQNPTGLVTQDLFNKLGQKAGELSQQGNQQNQIEQIRTVATLMFQYGQSQATALTNKHTTEKGAAYFTQRATQQRAGQNQPAAPAQPAQNPAQPAQPAQNPATPQAPQAQNALSNAPSPAQSISDEVKNIAVLLKEMGYQVDDKYTRGEYDPAFLDLTQKVLKDFSGLDSIKKLPKDADNADIRNALKSEIHTLKTANNGWKYQAFQNFAEGKGYLFYKHETIGEKLKEAGFTPEQISKDNVKGLARLIDKSEHYFQDMVEIEKYAAAQNNDHNALAKLNQEKKQLDNDIAQQINQKKTPEIGGFYTQIITTLVNSFPEELLSMIDELLRQFTGGKGLTDFIPGLENNPTIKNALGERSKDPEENAKNAFIKAFDGQADPTKSQTKLLQAVKISTSVPFGDADRKDAFIKAYQTALDKALEGYDPKSKAPLDNVEDRATKFASHFMHNMREFHNKHPDAALKSPDRPVMDPSLITKLQEAGVKAEDVMQAFEDINTAHEHRYDQKHEAVIFKGNDNIVYIAGILDHQSKAFTAFPLDSEQGRNFAKHNYGRNLAAHQRDAQGNITKDLDELIKRTLDKAQPFPDVKNYIADEYAKTLAKNQTENAALKGSSYTALVKEMDRQFEKAAQDRLGKKHNTPVEIRNARDTERMTALGRRAAKIPGRDGFPDNTGKPEVVDSEVSPKEAALMPYRYMLTPDAKHLKNQFGHAPGAMKRAIAKATLDDAPVIFEGQKGNAEDRTYAFGRKLHYNSERPIICDVTDELKKYRALTKAQQDEYAKDPIKMEKEFNNLTAIAKHYKKFDNALDVGKFFGTKEADLFFRAEQAAKKDLKTSFNTARGEEFQIAKADPNSLTDTFGNKAGQGSSISAFTVAKADITGEKPDNNQAPNNVITHKFQPADVAI